MNRSTRKLLTIWFNTANLLAFGYLAMNLILLVLFMEGFDFDGPPRTVEQQRRDIVIAQIGDLVKLPAFLLAPVSPVKNFFLVLYATGFLLASLPLAVWVAFHQYRRS